MVDVNPAAAPTVAVCSLFRDSADTLDYFRAVISAQQRGGVRLAFSFVEGDSGDDTFDRLSSWAADDPRVTLAQQHVSPVLDFDDRVRKWAALANQALEGALATGAGHILWCESDLALPHDLLPQLLAADADIVAPAVFLGGMFYDTWGFRGLDGERFRNESPYHPEFQAHALVPLSSVGSCVLFRRQLFDDGVRFRGTYEDGLLVGVCRDAALLGYRTFMDSRVAIVHPTSLWQRQLYKLERVEIDCPPDQDAVWADVADELAAEVALELGSLEYGSDHSVFGGVHQIIDRHLPGRPRRVRVALASEARKTYALTVEDLARAGS